MQVILNSTNKNIAILKTIVYNVVINSKESEIFWKYYYSKLKKER